MCFLHQIQILINGNIKTKFKDKENDIYLEIYSKEIDETLKQNNKNITRSDFFFHQKDFLEKELKEYLLKF